jgi:hypothetical protein
MSLLAGGFMFCASLFVAQAARADDSLWGKAMGAIGLGGNGQAVPDAANPPPAAQPAALAPPPAVAAPQSKARASAKGSSHPAAAEAPSAAPAAPSVAAAPPAENQNLLTNWFGWGRHNDESAGGDPVGAPTQAAAEAQRKAINPVSAPDAPAYAATPSSGGPSMWDKMFGSVGLQTKNVADTINYGERPKLTVPKERSLRGPAQAGGDPAPTRPANTDALVRPPGDYLEKVRGADGNVSGLRDNDIAKDKKLFGLF